MPSQGGAGFYLEHANSMDETHLSVVYPGESVVMACRKGTAWYVAGVDGKDESPETDHGFSFSDKEKLPRLYCSRIAERQKILGKFHTVRLGE